MEDHGHALSMLDALVKVPGALRVITAAHVCLSPPGLPRTGEELDGCQSYARVYSDPKYTNPLADPSHFVIHDVVEISDLDAKGRVTAHTAEGDYCTGYPAAVLQRLLEASMVKEADLPEAPPPEPEPEREWPAEELPAMLPKRGLFGRFR